MQRLEWQTNKNKCGRQLLRDWAMWWHVSRRGFRGQYDCSIPPYTEAACGICLLRSHQSKDQFTLDCSNLTCSVHIAFMQARANLLHKEAAWLQVFFPTSSNTPDWTHWTSWSQSSDSWAATKTCSHTALCCLSDMMCVLSASWVTAHCLNCVTVLCKALCTSDQ